MVSYFQKITMKIDIVETCPNFLLCLQSSSGLLSVDLRATLQLCPGTKSSECWMNRHFIHACPKRPRVLLLCFESVVFGVLLCPTLCQFHLNRCTAEHSFLLEENVGGKSIHSYLKKMWVGCPFIPLELGWSIGILYAQVYLSHCLADQ
jgi:hypothetical protein